MAKTLNDFLDTAHLHGLSDEELAALAFLYDAADEWSDAMEHCRGANNFNGRLHRAVAIARKTFGEITDARDVHRFCDTECVTCHIRPAVTRCRP